MRSIQVILLLITLSSCNNKEKHYYPTGELLSVVEIDNYKRNHGKLKEYYKTGELSGVGNYSKGKKNGIHIRYFKSGNTKSIETYKNDIRIDTTKVFFENGSLRTMRYKNEFGEFNKIFYSSGVLNAEGKSIDAIEKDWWSIYTDKGILRKEIEYLIIKDSSYANQIKYYDSSGSLLTDRSNFFDVIIKDTLNLKTSNDIIIKVQPFLSKKRNFFKVYYTILDENKLVAVRDSTYGKNNLAAVIRYYPKHSGNQTLNGYIFEEGFNFKENVEDSTLVNVIRKEKKMYFKSEFFVK